MQTLFAFLKLFPTLLSAVQAIEEAIPLPAVGKQKLDILLSVIKAAYDAEQSIQKEVAWDKLAAIISSASKTIVDAFNTLGLFHRGVETHQ